jgi:uncharacterized protein
LQVGGSATIGGDMSISIPAVVARRFVMGRQGLWPGRRWAGLEGTEDAMRTIEELQLDPLVVIARAHDLILQSRVIDYRPDDWATLTYDQRKFFDWGGWLAVRPMDELPYWRVVMRREIESPRLAEIASDHAAAVEEMRAALQERAEISNRDFAMSGRTRVDSYRGRKDSALALHYLWRTGEAMIARRERFERVYAATERVAPAAFVRDVEPAEADDFLLRKMVAGDGLLTKRIKPFALYKYRIDGAASAEWLDRRLVDGTLVEVHVDGWRAPQIALAADVPILEALSADRVPDAWRPLETTTEEEATFLSPLDPVSARGRARQVFDFDYVWEVYKPAEARRWGYYTLPILWGDRLVARFDSRLDRSAATLVINGLWLEDPALAANAAFREALRRGMVRFAAFLDARRVDADAVAEARLRRALSTRR